MVGRAHHPKDNPKHYPTPVLRYQQDGRMLTHSLAGKALKKDGKSHQERNEKAILRQKNGLPEADIRP